MKNQTRCIIAVLVCLVLFVFIEIPQCRGAANDSDQYRVSVFPYYPITGDLIGFNEFTFAVNPDVEVEKYYFGFPQVSFKANKWVGLDGGLRSIYTDNRSKPDVLELRPWAGVRFNVSNPWKWHIYNYARLEYRDKERLDDGMWSDSFRLRSRFGVEVPFSAREKAWKSKTWYGLADVEPAYAFDERKIDPVRVRGGIGYVFSERLRLEFYYGANFSRVGNGDLEHTANGFRLNINFAFADGLL